MWSVRRGRKLVTQFLPEEYIFISMFFDIPRIHTNNTTPLWGGHRDVICCWRSSFTRIIVGGTSSEDTEVIVIFSKVYAATIFSFLVASIAFTSPRAHFLSYISLHLLFYSFVGSHFLLILSCFFFSLFNLISIILLNLSLYIQLHDILLPMILITTM